MSDLRNDIEVRRMLDEVIERAAPCSGVQIVAMELKRKDTLLPRDYAYIRARHGELLKGVNDMAKRIKKDDGGGTAVLEQPRPGENPGEQGELFEVNTKDAKKFKQLGEELMAARRAKKKAKDKEDQTLDAIRELAHECDIQADDDGFMHFKAEDLEITVAPRDETVIVKPVSRTPSPSRRGRGESPD